MIPRRYKVILGIAVALAFAVTAAWLVKDRRHPGEIVFRSPTPPAPRFVAVPPPPEPQPSAKPAYLVQFGEFGVAKLGWKANPWRPPPFKGMEVYFRLQISVLRYPVGWKPGPSYVSSPDLGDHFLELRLSEDPSDRRTAELLQAKADPVFETLLRRYPELAVEMKSVPDDRNGFVKWWRFTVRMAAPGAPDLPSFSYCDDGGSSPDPSGLAWDRKSTQAWIDKNAGLLSEIHEIGMTPEQSIHNVRVPFPLIDERLFRRCHEVLLGEATLAAEEGRGSAALAAIAAAHGLQRQFTEIETAGFAAAYIRRHARQRLNNQVIQHILPSLPPAERDLPAWEAALDLQVSPQADLSNFTRGEWHTMMREMLLPALLDPLEADSSDDPAAVIDALSNVAAAACAALKSMSANAFAKCFPLPAVDLSALSQRDRYIVRSCYSSDYASIMKSWFYGECETMLTLAAFQILRGGPAPVDPLLGLPFRYDPASRELQTPDDPFFNQLHIQALTVPELERP